MIYSLQHSILIIAFSLCCVFSFAQQTDSLTVKATADSVTDTVHTHSVLKATLYSTAFPGLGQIYNRKYWKLPIIYGGLGATTYFIVDNHRQYKNYLNAFYAITDNDSTTIDPFGGRYDERQLIELQNIYRKWRDLSIIVTAAIYALNVLDAHVDAHLFYYDVSEDLTFRWEPAVINSGLSNSVGMSLKLVLR